MACRHEDALEATRDAACLRPSLLRPQCVQAIAYRGMDREADAQSALDRTDRIWQEALAVRAQRALLRSYQRFVTADAVSFAEISHTPMPPPQCQPPLPPPAWHAMPPPPPLGSTPSLGGPGWSLLLAALDVEDLCDELLKAMSLHAKRTAACACHVIRRHVAVHLAQPTLKVRTRPPPPTPRCTSDGTGADC
jgi:hypothetical protein